MVVSYLLPVSWESVSRYLINSLLDKIVCNSGVKESVT